MQQATLMVSTPGRSPQGLAAAGSHGPTIAAPALRPLARSLQDAGLDARKFLSHYALTPQSLECEGARVPFEHLRCIWEHAVAESKDGLVGVRAGLAALKSGLFGGPGGRVRPLTARAAAEEACARLRSLSRRTYCHVSSIGSEIVVITEGCEEPLVAPIERQQALEFIVCAASSYVRACSSDVTPRFFFPHERPAGLEYERVLGCEVHFGTPLAGFAIACEGAADLGETADATQNPLRAGAMHASSAGEFMDRLENAVAEALAHGGDANLETLARRLATSARTLQRRLQELGTSHRSVIDRVRKQMAIDLFRSADVSISDIAYRLGFSDGVAFHRAFKRWTGTTPGAFRERSRASAT